MSYFSDLFSLHLTAAESKLAVAGLDVSKTEVIQHNLDTALSGKQTLNISTIIFWIACLVISGLSVVKKYSLIPLLGLATCLYLLTGMTAKNWAWFGSWLAVGLVIYLLYGYRKSKLAKE
ncbi:MAG: hypothetical protein IPP72_20960 [Chitinophagaceae bacterium]|nr:hypothetical protein [Chitinophagaceae bacterium]